MNIDKAYKILESKDFSKHEKDIAIIELKRNDMYKDWDFKSLDEEKLNKLLPHGSGIDCTWEYKFYKNKNIKCYNSFHLMDENGYYDGWVNFSVKIFKWKSNKLRELKGPMTGFAQIIHKIGDIDFKIYCNNKRKSGYGLIDFLYEEIYFSLVPILTETQEILDLEDAYSLSKRQPTLWD